MNDICRRAYLASALTPAASRLSPLVSGVRPARHTQAHEGQITIIPQER